MKSASTVALFAAAGLFVGGVAMPSAKAADLGGDCCADLEERVAELEATTARKGNRRMSLTVSGQVNTAVMAWDDARDSDIYIVDNAVSRSAFEFNGTARINPNLTAGFQMVIGLAAGARSHQVTHTDDDGGANDGTLGVELANWYLKSDTLGEIRVGRLNHAAAGSTQVDLGGAGVIANSNIGLWQRSFLTVAPNGGFLAFTWSQHLGGTTMNIAGLSRGNAVLYTSPTLGGFSVSASYGEDNLWDAALRYAGEFSGFRVAAAVAFSHNACGQDECVQDVVGGINRANDQVKGSASVLHVASGLYLSGAYVRQDNDLVGVPDSRMYYLQGGISKNWTGLGNTVVYGEYARVNDGLSSIDAATGVAGLATKDEATVWGVGVVQHIDAAAMELYLAYRMYSAECAPCIAISDFDVVMGGARIRF